MTKILEFLWASLFLHQATATFQLFFEPQKSSLFYVNSSNKTVIDNLVTSVDNLLKDYETPQYENMVDCRNTTVSKLPKEKVCKFPVTNKTLGDCSKNSHFSYGYRRGAPCAFLKFKTDSNWTPEYHDCDSAVAAKAPISVGREVCSWNTEKTKEKIWVSCEGAELVDKELIGPIALFPQPAFDEKYLVNRDVDGWLSPLVAIHFQRPSLQGILVKVVCKAWAKNIDHNRGDGIVTIEMMTS